MEVERKLQNQKEVLNKEEQKFTCDECGNSFGKKADRRKHINVYHPKPISCEFCDMIFSESWEYETHLETHTKTKDKKCKVCDKEFYLEWRYRQLMNVHENPNIKTFTIITTTKCARMNPLAVNLSM